ncbi:N-acetylmuramoyl-L-alanine amidase [Desulforhopalus sp. IMCC35007]|uniref:N-acetylmuramoyl-L-alanine amidase n=1 Tax=Desulforhopalus sp. IMCC35007 TaxID=2569543 RepID=UPI0010AE5704|nr:N-acetylmuramoyl-L-alanine amidase [Desulforhopalus sp. IMCC35007]TKB12199.1 AMIN domain-containing protein [Desulforhopalus sp. IMCC35007]
MHRTLLITILITIHIFFVLGVSLAAEPKVEGSQLVSKRYDEAKFYYNQLQTNAKLSATRDNWLKGTRNFRRIYLSSPKSTFAPACLYMLGRLYRDMFEAFTLPIDIDESVSYYKDIVRLFPQHKLADDAYFQLASIFIKKNEPKKAAEYLVEIVTNYSNGDMHSQAEDMLKVLSKEHDIALPKVMVSATGDNNLSYVLPVKYWSSDHYTRVVIMASGPVNYKEVLLEETKNTPRRLYIDFKDSYIEPQYRAPVPIKDGLLEQIRTGQFSPDTVRVVLDIESIGSYKIFSLPDPFRVVIDVRGKGHEDLEQVAVTEIPKIEQEQQKNKPKLETPSSSEIVVLKPSKKKAVTVSESDTTPSSVVAKKDKDTRNDPKTNPLSLAQQLGLGVKKIVLDPGHGGKDPGAMAFKLKEKDIVLKVAQTLAPVLEKALGCEVILTRDKDVFVSLEERTAIANTENADLFISLHVNAHPSQKVRGLETYYLNLTTNAEAMRVAALENATSTHQMSDLQDILSDIMKNSKIEESSRLAQQVHNSILDEAAAKGYADIKNLGVKQAPFYVLIGAQMPAILIELAFITNKDDVQNLNDPAFIRLLTQEIADGIHNYVSSTTAQFQAFNFTQDEADSGAEAM